MKKFRVVGLMMGLAVSLVGPPIIGEEQIQDREWGVPVNGLRCSIKAHKEAYELGASSNIEFRLQNIGQEPIMVNKRLIVAFELKFDITDSTGKKVTCPVMFRVGPRETKTLLGLIHRSS